MSRYLVGFLGILMSCSPALAGQAEVQNVVGSESTLDSESPDSAESNLELAASLVRQRNFKEAEPIYRKAIQDSEMSLGGEHPRTLALINNLAFVYIQMTRSAEAETLLIRALGAHERVLGPDHPNTIESLSMLGGVYFQLRRYDEAEPLLIRALERCERAFGEDHPKTIRNIANLAFFYESKDRVDQAEILQNRALAARERVFGADHPETLASVDKLADLLFELGRYDDAEPLLRRAVESNERLKGAEHPETLSSIDKLARLHEAQGRDDRAEPLYRRELETKSRLLGEDHADTQDTLLQLLLLYDRQNRKNEAEPLYLRALGSRDRLLGPDHPESLLLVDIIAHFYDDQGRLGDAEPFFRRALDTRTRLLGSDHPDTLETTNDLAVNYTFLGRFDEAEPLALQSLQAHQRLLGQENFNTWAQTINLGSLYMDMRRYEDAERLILQALDSVDPILGENSIATIIAVNSLADLYSKIDRENEAETLYLRALAASDRLAENKQGVNLLTSDGLAQLYHLQGRHSEAEQLFLKALAESERVLGEDDLITLNLSSHLADLYLDVNRAADAAPLYWRYHTGIMRTLPGPNPVLALSYADLGKLMRIQHRDLSKAAYFYKRAVNTLQDVRQDMAKMDDNTQRTFMDRFSGPYLALQEILIERGRFAEAEQVGRMLKDVEYTVFVRGAEDDAARDQIALTQAEIDWERELQSWLGTPNRLGRERSTLIQASRERSLTALEQKQLADLDAAHGAAYNRFFSFIADWTSESEAIDNQEIEREARALTLEQSRAVRRTVADIGPDVALLQAVAFEDRLHLFFITGETFVHEEVAVSRKDLFRLIFDAREIIDEARYFDFGGDEARAKELQTPLGELYRLLIAPVDDELAAAGTQTLMLNLQGQIRYLPFAALWDGDEYLAQKLRLAIYTPAANTNYSPPQTLSKGRGFGLSSATQGFNPLPNVPLELEYVIGSQSSPGMVEGEYFLNEGFTRASFEAGLVTPTPIIHLATHFKILPGDEASSFLVLGDGTRISIAEINRSYKYEFDGVELLTLSACETALGAESTGMELEGFGVLAQNKGAASVMATLWQVSDDATPEFMRTFYRGIARENLSKAEAMRQAQIEMMNSEEYVDPYFWAPFVIMGNWM